MLYFLHMGTARRWRNYQDYQKSEIWKLKKELFKELWTSVFPWECCGCGTDQNIDVHHIRYPKLWGSEPVTWLRPFCRECHEKMTNILKKRKYASRQIEVNDIQYIYPKRREVKKNEKIEFENLRDSTPTYAQRPNSRPS